MYIYFVQAGEKGPVKVGLSKNPMSRVKQLQTSNPHTLKLLGIIPGDRETEEMIHDKFEDHRLEGEWFEPTNELIDIVRSLLDDQDRLIKETEDARNRAALELLQ